MKTGIVIRNYAIKKEPVPGCAFIGTPKTLDFGFIKIGKEEVAFTPNTKLVGCKNLKSLKVGKTVKVVIEETSRGLHAKKIIIE